MASPFRGQRVAVLDEDPVAGDGRLGRRRAVGDDVARDRLEAGADRPRHDQPGVVVEQEQEWFRLDDGGVLRLTRAPATASPRCSHRVRRTAPPALGQPEQGVGEHDGIGHSGRGSIVPPFGLDDPLGAGPWLAVVGNMSYGAPYVVRQRTLPVPAFNDVITSSPFGRVNMKTRWPTMIGVA